MRFRDRTDAGRSLARTLEKYREDDRVIVLALPRGGVPVAAEVAKALNAPLDVFLVRKLGTPHNEELALGAVASGGVRVLNPEVIAALGIPSGYIDRITAIEQRELQRREALYHGPRLAPAVAGKAVILVDDGLATGATMRAAVQALRQIGPLRIIVAVPTAAPEVCEQIGREVDEIVCLTTPEPFIAVGAWYEDFSPTTDDEVRRLLQEVAQARSSRECRK